MVGSGPSGVSAAWALLEEGRRVCMLDVGITLEPERRDRVSALAKAGDVEGCRALIRGEALIQCAPSNFFRKLSHGSDFPYRRADDFVAREPGPVEAHSSFALGGLSNVWGAAVLPFAGDDIADWPLQKDELVPHYRAVASFMKIAGCEDSLARHFPFFAEPAPPFDLSPEAEAMLYALDKRKERLEDQGIHAGRARVAVGPEHSGDKAGASFPELYIYGATDGATFNSADVVESLKANPNFEYLSDVTVTGFQEESESVRLLCEHAETGEAMEFEGARVYLACGILPTARIVLSSLAAYDRPVSMRQSLHFMLPVLHFLPAGPGQAGGANSLAEIYLLVREAEGTGNWAFLVLNRLSEFFLDRIRERHGPLAGMVRVLQSSPFLNVFICQGFLHSNISPVIQLTLVRGRQGSKDGIRLSAKSPLRAVKAARRIVKRLARATRPIGIFPVGAAFDAEVPGRGNHLGGTFPMRSQPGELECDPWGRIKGLSRVHILDASVLPSIPATTITYGVMANAHRIAKGSCGL